MQTLNKLGFQLLLGLLGLMGIYLGLDFGLGGIESLGWQGLHDFVIITDEAMFGVQDSNMHFLGGMLAAVGVFVLWTLTDVQKYQQALRLIFGIIFMGGWFRVFTTETEILQRSDMIGALSVELGLMLILYVWLGRLVTSDQPKS